MQKIERIEFIEKQITKYVAEDGVEFERQQDCFEYEHEKALEKLICIEQCDELENHPNFNGGECYENHCYTWYHPMDSHEIELLKDAYGDNFSVEMIGKWVCVETDAFDDSFWVTMLDDGISYAQYILEKLGYEVIVKNKE